MQNLTHFSWSSENNEEKVPVFKDLFVHTSSDQLYLFKPINEVIVINKMTEPKQVMVLEGRLGVGDRQYWRVVKDRSFLGQGKQHKSWH